MAIRIITDSAADYSAQDIQKRQITCIPMTVTFGDKEYLDGRDISKEEFFAYREDYLKKEELYKKQTETLEEKVKESVTKDVFQTPWLKRLLEMKEIEKLDRDMIVEMIDQIVVYENRKIKIRYNFGNELEHLFSSVYQESKVV